MQSLFRPLPILIAIIVLLVGATSGWLLLSSGQPTIKKAATSHLTSSNAHLKNVNSTTSSTSTSITPSTNNVSAADKAVASARSTVPVTQACELFTLGNARQVLGPGTQSISPTDTTSYRSSGTTVSACAYANGDNTAQLIIRASTSPLGSSENATEFGSGRPTNAVTVEGFGQSAYWDPSQHILNVLGNNDWYIITRSTNTQDDTEKVANLLIAGF
jgi:hypothetical protein